MRGDITLTGVRQHNLRNIDIRIPNGRMTVVTGLSGSGKSSLVFDTLYAEGQRRYVESLSTYARQFLERMPKPDLDHAENIPPAIAIQQKNPVKNSRSTVATLTEIYDYLRLLFAAAGKIHCPSCDGIATRDTPQSVADEILADFSERRGYILFPLLDEDLKEPERVLEAYRRRGFVRGRLDGEVVELEGLDPKRLDKAGEFFIVSDRLVVRARDRTRLTGSIEQAFREGHGEMVFWPVDGESRGYCEELNCCGVIYDDPTPQLFSFNSPAGACAHCRGFGNTLEYDERKFIPRPELSLRKGAIEPWTKPSLREYQRELLQWAREQGVDVDLPWRRLPKKTQEQILKGTKEFTGVFPFFTEAEEKKYKLHVRVFLRRYQSHFPCPKCEGKRLNDEALLVKVGGKDIAEVTFLRVGEILKFIDKLKLTESEQAATGEVLRQIGSRLRFLDEVGLDYLTLARLARTLSGGEHQRINLANQLGAALVGTLYVLDEPTVGLHARDVDRLTGVIERIVETGNTAVVVEHDPAVIRRGQKILELGPGSGARGGEIVFDGSVEDLIEDEATLTARYLRGELDFPRPRSRKQNKGWLKINGARENNLRDVNVRIPLGNFVCVSGVSGSGKSTLVTKTVFPALDRLFGTGTAEIGRFGTIAGFEPLDGVSLIDQSPIGRSSRSNPITYMKGWDEIRSFYAELPAARSRGLKPKHFSFNTEGGRCPACQGEGVITVEMHFLADVEVECEVCRGKRFKPEVLEVAYRDRSISGVLDLTVSEARQFFPPMKSLKKKLQLLEEVGLGYLRLGQSSTTLSGGEAQRLKIAAELGRRDGRNVLYILDEPTTGLHGADVARLLDVFDRLVERGNSVLVIEHNLDVLSRADWLIDLGPEGGDGGGRIVAEGPPSEIVGAEGSHTGRFLRGYLQHHPVA